MVPPDVPAADSGEPPSVAGQRYTLSGVLGRGGMAVVYDAFDRVRGHRVALKQLQAHADATKYARNVELFELEFHTLAQLAHPRVVEVYDFGVDPSGAYFTMELLDGGDLQGQSPLPWRTACAIARDVCSALSLLHSRKFVHRDVSPRNVRRTIDGSAKLIDFGALAPVGPNKLLVGTPPCCAPESVHLQPLDGRTDLYALGATLYFMLVGHHAYTAHNFAVLHDAWAASLVPPSAFVRDVPPALDALVLELLRLEPDARPASAAEVMQRLLAIDGATPHGELLVAQAYLTTPSLVGRDTELARVSRRLSRIAARQGRSIVIEGQAGVGCSRFLDACALEATLRGLLVVRADAEDARDGELSAAAALARRVFRLIPDVARAAAEGCKPELAAFVPELDGAGGEQSPIPARRPASLQTWFERVAAVRPLVIAVDDFHLLDAESAGFVSLLAGSIDEHGLGVLASVQRDADAVAPAAVKMLADASTRVRLEPLSLEHSEKLLASLFGGAPKVGLLAHRMNALCAGNPRDLLQLAQHLVDRGDIQYRAGAWTLPADLDALELPSTLAQAQRTRLAALRESARALACALALCPDQRFSPGECALLCDTPDAASLLADLEVLSVAGVVRREPDAIGLAQPSLASLLCELLPPERVRVVRHRLAGVFSRRNDPFNAGSQWLRAGETARALDVLVPFAEAALHQATREDETRTNGRLRAPPPDFYETYLAAIRACDALGRPARHKFALLSRLTFVATLFDLQEYEPISELLTQFRRDSGLDDWIALEGQVAADARLAAALNRARERYEQTPEPLRVLDPVSAIRQLARVVGSALTLFTRSLDLTGLRALPDLKPLIPLSPALRVIALLVDGLGARLSGRITHARCVYEELVVLIERDDRAGLDPTVWGMVRMSAANTLGMIEAVSGLAGCLARSEQLAESPAYEVNAVVIRMLHALFQGNLAAADLAKERVDRLRIQGGRRQLYEGGHLIWELDAHVLSEDLTRLRHTVDALAPLARRFPAWRPVVRYAAAEHKRICGAFEPALREIEAALEPIAAGEHQAWASIATSHLRTLLEAGRVADAVARADDYAAQAEAALGEVPAQLQLVRAWALAANGRTEAALLAEQVSERLLAQGVSGLYIGYAHEIRARIALALGNRADFDRFLAECSAIYNAHRNPALRAKGQRLRDAARINPLGSVERMMNATPDSANNFTMTRVGAVLQSCRDAGQRARLALTLMTKQSGALAGFLFGLHDRGIECIATVGDRTLPPPVLAQVQAYLSDVTDAEATTSTDSEVTSPGTIEWLADDGTRYRPVLISHQAGGQLVVTGIALLVVSASGKFDYPADLAREVSRASANLGDVSLSLSLAD